MEPRSTPHLGSDQGKPDVCPASKSSRRTAAIRYNVDARIQASTGQSSRHCEPAAQVQTVPLPNCDANRSSPYASAPWLVARSSQLRLHRLGFAFAGRTNASVPTRSEELKTRSYFFPYIGASNSSSRAELQDAIFQAADPHCEHVAEVVLADQPRCGRGLFGQIG